MPIVHIPIAEGKDRQHPLIAGNNTFLSDVINTTASEPTITNLSSGFYRQEKGEPLVYTYTYDEMKVILEGNLRLEDETGFVVEAKPGDTFFFRKGTTVTFSSTDYGLSYFVGLRPADTA